MRATAIVRAELGSKEGTTRTHTVRSRSGLSRLLPGYIHLSNKTGSLRREKATIEMDTGQEVKRRRTREWS